MAPMFPLLFMFTMAPKLPAKLLVSYGPKVSGIIFVWFAMAPMFPFSYGPQVSSIVFQGPKMLNGPKVSGIALWPKVSAAALSF